MNFLKKATARLFPSNKKILRFEGSLTPTPIDLWHAVGFFSPSLSLSSAQTPDPDNHQASCHSSSLRNVWKPPPDFTYKKKTVKKEEGWFGCPVLASNEDTPAYIKKHIINITVKNCIFKKKNAHKIAPAYRKVTFQFDFGWLRPEAALWG